MKREFPKFVTQLVQQSLAYENLLLEKDIDDIWGTKTESAYNKFIELNSPKKSNLKDSSRTDWNIFVDYNHKYVEDVLPLKAKVLVGSFFFWAKEFNLNPLFLIAISKHETGNWTSNVFKTKNNAMGISNSYGAISLPSYDESIRRAAYSLGRKDGYYSKAKSLEDVGNIYAPVGAGNDPTKVNKYWPDSVAKYWSELEDQISK